MYIYMGMFFKSPQDVPDFGSITMYFVGTKQLGYVEEGHKRFRKYAFQSTDLNKLSLITNAIDGSEAFAVDTGTTYVLYDGQWSVKSSELNPTKIAEILENITQIDYQIVNQLPQTGVKGTIYLIANETAQGDYYDEYIYINNAYEKMGNTAPAISTMTGATANAAGAAGLVPAPTSSEKDYFLKGDGTWSQINVTNTDTTYTLAQDPNDGHKITFTSSTGSATTITIPDDDTTYNAATQQADGLMSSTDKTKLDNITVADLLTTTDIVVCTQDQYDQLQSKPALLYFIKQDEGG